jgi:hypothetical protein
MAKRSRSPPLPSCYSSRRPLPSCYSSRRPLSSCYSSRRPSETGGSDENDGGVNVKYEYNDNAVGNQGDNDPFLPYVEHHDGRRFWSDRFYLNANANANITVNVNNIDNANNTEKTSTASLDCNCDCGSSQAPPTFPLVDFVNQSLDVKAAVMGTFNIHPEWFRQNFPRFCERRKSSSDGIGTEDSDNDNDNDNDNNKSVAYNTTVPTFILHGHRGLENALAKRVQQADEIEYETDRDDDEGDDDDIGDHQNSSKSKNSKRGSPRRPSIEQSSKFRFFLPATAKATETARHFVNNPDLQLCQVHCNWEKRSSINNNNNINNNDNNNSNDNNNNKSKTSPVGVRVRVSSDKENSENDDEKSKKNNNTTTTRETKFGVHHPKFLLLFEQSGDLVVIVTTSNLTPTNKSTVEGSWVQRFRRRCQNNRRTEDKHEHDGSYRAKRNRKSIPRCNNQQQQRQQQQKGQENDFGPVLQDFLVQLSEAAAAGAEQMKRREGSTIPLTNNNNNTSDKSGNCESSSSSSSNHLPLEEFLSKHIGLKSLSEFSELYHFENAQTYLVPIVPGDYKYDPSNSSTSTRGDDDDDDNNYRKSPTRFYYGRQRVRYILDELATYTPKISKKTQDKSKSDRLLLQPTSLGNDWSRSQFASLVREYMGYYGGGNNNSNSTNAIAQKSENTKTLPKRKRTHMKKKKTDHDYSYHRDDFWVCRQADIVWPSDRFMVGVAKSSMQSFGSNGANNSPLQAAATTTRCNEGGESPTRTTVMNLFVFNSSRTFNACDLEFIARMAKYQPSKPCQLSHRSSNTNTNTCTTTSSNRNKNNKNNNSHASNSVEPVVSRAPHFKSIARLFQNHVAMQKRDVPPADAYFSWFLLTSACLSMGAQGAAVVDDVSGQRQQQLASSSDRSYDYSSSSSTPPLTSVTSTVAYRNFELGVLFASHLPKKPKTSSNTKGLPATIDSRLEQEKQRRSVVYCFHPKHCSCGDKDTTDKMNANDRGEKITNASDKNLTFSSMSSPPQLVHLPVPYNLRPESYFQERYNEEGDDDDDDTEMVMKENPFFHEISDESRCIGNMLLTPFGQREINRTEL